MICASCGKPVTPGAASCGVCGADTSPFATTAAGEVTATASSQQESAPRIYAGRFRLLEMVGKGGMGEVWRARDTTLNEDVAVKILPPFRPDEPDVERFKREIVTARRISHPNVMRVFEFGTQDKAGFISMELLAGGTLADRLESGLLPIPDALRIAIGISEGLAAAHEAGIVHRDVKPQNVLFDSAGRPKIADFGLARLSDATATTVGFSGTPQYMSPEMADGREVTSRSDVYSFGILLFEVFTGKRPFAADTLVRMIVLHQKEAPPSLRAIRAELSESIETIVHACLRKAPDARPTMEEVVTALRAAGEGMPLPKFAALPATPVKATAEAYTIDPRTRVSAVIPRRKPIALAVGIGAVALLAIATPFVVDLGGSETPVPTATALVVEATPVPIETATPAPVKTVAVAKTTPRPAATKRPAIVASGTLVVKSFPWVKVVVDGIVIDEQTPMPPRKLEAGTHRVVLTNPAHKFSRELVITIEGGKDTTITADPAGGTARVSTR